eukprot:TRINITY_DN6730_c0_g1_i1.p1 TRINITY_DN6730_c0_g1~~TRINITY_DN6730_c0_g1_i1.p1  ORF type:complete len:727 (+),score=281.01 TRINITY_DN6730_c0_g1_i1:41-2221(+)
MGGSIIIHTLLRLLSCEEIPRINTNHLGFVYFRIYLLGQIKESKLLRIQSGKVRLSEEIHLETSFKSEDFSLERIQNILRGETLRIELIQSHFSSAHEWKTENIPLLTWEGINVLNLLFSSKLEEKPERLKNGYSRLNRKKIVTLVQPPESTIRTTLPHSTLVFSLSAMWIVADANGANLGRENFANLMEEEIERVSEPEFESEAHSSQYRSSTLPQKTPKKSEANSASRSSIKPQTFSPSLNNKRNRSESKEEKFAKSNAAKKRGEDRYTLDLWNRDYNQMLSDQRDLLENMYAERDQLKREEEQFLSHLGRSRYEPKSNRGEEEQMRAKEERRRSSKSIPKEEERKSGFFGEFARVEDDDFEEESDEEDRESFRSEDSGMETDASEELTQYMEGDEEIQMQNLSEEDSSDDEVEEELHENRRKRSDRCVACNDHDEPPSEPLRRWPERDSKSFKTPRKDVADFEEQLEKVQNSLNERIQRLESSPLRKENQRTNTTTPYAESNRRNLFGEENFDQRNVQNSNRNDENFPPRVPFNSYRGNSKEQVEMAHSNRRKQENHGKNEAIEPIVEKNYLTPQRNLLPIPQTDPKDDNQSNNNNLGRGYSREPPTPYLNTEETRESARRNQQTQHSLPQEEGQRMRGLHFVGENDVDRYKEYLWNETLLAERSFAQIQEIEKQLEQKKNHYRNLYERLLSNGSLTLEEEEREFLDSPSFPGRRVQFNGGKS